MSMGGMWMVMGSLLAAGAGPAESTPQDAPKAAQQPELAKLQGSWRALKLQVGGRTVDVPGRSKKDPGVSLELHGDHYEFRGLGADFKGQIRLNAGGKRKRIEFVRNDGVTTVSAYQLDGDSLKLTGVTANQEDETAAKDADVWTFKREKP